MKTKEITNENGLIVGEEKEEGDRQKLSEHGRIGRLIADIRTEIGFSVRRLAEISGVSYQNITKIENGKYNVSISILSKIVNSLEYEISLIDKRTELKKFILANRNRGDMVGDLCYDLLRDDEFVTKRTEKEQRSHILVVGQWHYQIQEAVIQLFKEYSGEEIVYEEY